MTLLACACCIWSSVVSAPGPVTVADRAVVVGDRVEVCWTTAVPTVGQVEFGPTPTLGQVSPEDPSSLRGSTNAGRTPGVGVANNHRAYLPLPAAWPLHYRITAKTADGAAVTSPSEAVARPAAVKGFSARATVPLRIDRGGWTLPVLPVTAGVPLPVGQLGDDGAVRIRAGEREVPCQATIVARWAADRSVKWLRLHFVVPAEVKEVTLEYGRDVVGVRPAAVTSTAAQRLDLALGRVRVTSERVTVGDRSVAFPAVVLTDAQGVVYTARPRAVVMLETGPVRQVAEVQADLVDAQGRRLLGCVLTVQAFADLPAVRLDVRLENDNTKDEFTAFRSLGLRFAGLVGPVTVGDADKVTLTAGQRVWQREDSEWAVEPTGKTGKRLAGLVETAPARLVMRHFWEQYPASVAVADDSLELGLYPALPADFYRGRQDEDKFYYHLRKGLYEFRQGFTKTHRVWIDLSGQPSGRSLLSDPPTALATPQWLEDTGALRRLAVSCRNRLPGFDTRIQQIADTYLAHRDSAREYGVMSFGDWYGERTWNWGNLEYDLGHALLDEYARTGLAALYHRATETLEHEGDVDTRHFAADPRRVGQQWIHSMGHTGGYYPPEYKDMHIYASPGWSDNRGHIWCQGLLQQYLLGGDRRQWDSGLLIADWAAGPQTTNFQYGLAREPGWMVLLVMAAYNATEDPYYLNAARLMLRVAHQKSVDSGDRGFYYHPLYGGHCDCEQKHSGEAGFMLGVQMTAMVMYYERQPDDVVADDVVKCARFIVETMWEAERSAFRYTSCPKTGASAGSVYIMLEGLAFAAERSRDAGLAAITREALAAAWEQLPASGKSAGYALCALPQGLDRFVRLPGESLTERQARVQAWMRNPARRALPALLYNPDFEQDAEGYFARAGAKLQRVTDDPHSGSAALRITGTLTGQNEYLVTRYDGSADTAELRGLKPGETYRLTVWLKVNALSPGAPAPTCRLAFRDDSGTRGAEATNAYDLKRLGTWQKLTADIRIPEWNTRNYLALNTNTRASVTADLLLDDLSLVPVAQADRDTYCYVRLLPTAAGGLTTSRDRTGQWWTGPASVLEASVPAAGDYRLWLKLSGKGEATVSLNGVALGQVAAAGEPLWVRLAAPRCQLRNRVEITLGPGLRLGYGVLTNDPTGAQ